MRELTTTSYAILGLLAIKPWTTYELARQMQKSLRNFWPRAESKLYEEPKKLVEAGLARVRKEQTGRRPRSVYAITPKGRRAMRAWLDGPGAPPSLEFEGLVKVFFAEHGTTPQLRRTLEVILGQASQRVDQDAAFARRYLEDGGDFPERLAILALVGRLQSGLNRALLEWASWALTATESWPEDPSEAEPDTATFELVAGRREAVPPAQ